MEMVQNVKPLFGLHQWSFVDTDVQKHAVEGSGLQQELQGPQR